MPPTRPTRSRAGTSAALPRPTSRPAAGTTGPHVVDRALAVHALLAAGRTPAEVQRRLGKSKGYVSVLGYLGAALAGLEPDDLARLRHSALTPRVVWPLVTRTRTDQRAALKEALGAAVTEAGREQAGRRAQARATVALRSALRGHVQAATAGLAAPPRARGGRRSRAVVPHGIATLAWDAAAWAADPLAYARAHLAALAAAHRVVTDAATHAARTAAAERVLGGHFAAKLDGRVRPHGRLTPQCWRALADAARAGRTPAEVDALALLAYAARGLRVPPPGATTGPLHGGGASGDGPTWADVDADLAE